MIDCAEMANHVLPVNPPSLAPASAEGSDSERDRMRVPSGRCEPRIAKTELVKLLHLDESAIAKVEAFTENVSPQGARVITGSVCAPGKLVRLDALEEPLKLTARVVYCQRLAEEKFAVGLQLDVRVEKWQRQKPPNP